MKSWDQRTHEVAYLLNPAFCGRLLYATIKEYEHKAQHAFPFPLVYLVLPLVLHKQTRSRINSRTHLLQWIQINQYLLIGFSKRAHELVIITNEALELLLHSGVIQFTPNGELSIIDSSKKLSKRHFIDHEIYECIVKSEHVARWFVRAGKIETIYIGLGVRP